MSELPEIIEKRSNPQTQEESVSYRHYFGLLARQAAINSVCAYVEGSHSLDKPDDRNVTIAWLLHDTIALDMFLGQKHQEAKLHAAMMRTSTSMWAHIFMQRYTGLRPDRLRGLAQSEIPVA